MFRDGSVTQDGFIFMPLQGRLREHRSFQTIGPIDMIKATPEASPLPIRASLHSKKVHGVADHAVLRRFRTAAPGADWCRPMPATSWPLGTMAEPAPDYAAYLWRFFKQTCTNCGAPEAKAQITARRRDHGWPV